ncbi:Protein CBG26919 [Caenorhabditis briggsae]|uniref:Protein CBG26919 n=1 Tax=Caenorhabditis briggsae TaxID=6238 RepID=B6IER2_CAEBR|nr:Protein CBG26919 [Caenorhabditis briggsae]CAR98392.1 Protein CBG26919 [Caenorhabditis briggsae]
MGKSRSMEKFRYSHEYPPWENESNRR